MISKDLLNLVLYSDSEDEVYGINEVRDNQVIFTELCRCEGLPDSLIRYGINIYELAFKCKDFIYKNNGLIVSKNHRTWNHPSTDYTDDYEVVCYVYKNTHPTTITRTFIFNSEPEAVFKACEWFLSQKEL